MNDMLAGLAHLADPIVLIAIVAAVLFAQVVAITPGLGGAFILAVIILLPLTFRLSRSLWIHMFVRYEGPCNEIRKL